MVIRDAAADLCALLEGQTLADVALVAGENLFSSGRQTPVSRPAVYLGNAGGAAPTMFLGGSRDGVFAPSVQVLVEGLEDSWSSGESLARAVYETLNLADVDGYLSVGCRDSQPVYLGENLWVVNVDALYGPP